jgi:hypothetical protein
MKKLTIASALLTGMLVFACSKSDKDTDEEGTTASPEKLIVGNWNYLTQKAISHISGVADTANHEYTSKDSLIFTIGNKVYAHVASQGFSDTSTYRFISDSTLIMWGDTTKTLLITENRATLYTRHTVNDPSKGDYEEIWVDLRK